jgi:hypothetical protein
LVVDLVGQVLLLNQDQSFPQIQEAIETFIEWLPVLGMY